MNIISIRTEYIRLGQFLKLANIIGSGGEAKMYLMLNDIEVNSEPEQRRGRKLYPGDLVTIASDIYTIIKNED